MGFSVLMSVYHGTNSDDLERCLESLISQEKKPGQIVLVQDGPIKTGVKTIITNFEELLPIQRLIFQENRGLGLALRDGLGACRYELIARVDSDDISLPQRFTLQTQYLKKHPNVSVVGSWMSENFSQGTHFSSRIRKTPPNSITVRSYARSRNPLNHPTVMFRRSDVLAVGSYQPCLMFEDYFLWVRLLQANYQIANLASTLVETTVDTGYFLRRGGISYLRHEINLLSKFISIGYFSRVDALKFLAIRMPMRLLPSGIRKALYYSVLRTRSPSR